MEHRQLGRTGVSVSKLCLGAMMFGAWGNPDHDDSIRGIESDVLHTCAKYAMGVMTYSPLAGGWLSGPLAQGSDQPGSTRAARLPERFDLSLPANQRKLDATEQLAQLADDVAIPLIRIAIAFVLNHPAVTAAIIGPRTMEHRESQLPAADVVLDDALPDRIDEIVAPVPTSTPATPASWPAGRTRPWSRERGADRSSSSVLGNTSSRAKQHDRDPAAARACQHARSPAACCSNAWARMWTAACGPRPRRFARVSGFCKSPPVSIRAPVERSAAVTLSALAALHAVWATGSSWPAKDRAALAELMAGRAGGSVPPAAACLTVATLLTSAAVLVSGRPRRPPALRRAGARAVAAVLGVRGAFGMAGRTDLVSPGSTAPRFRRLDRRYYSPLCLVLAAAAASSARA